MSNTQMPQPRQEWCIVLVPACRARYATIARGCRNVYRGLGQSVLNVEAGEVDCGVDNAVWAVAYFFARMGGL